MESTANPKERKNLRIPSNPDQDYNGIGWIDWDRFLDKPKPLPVLTVTAGCKKCNTPKLHRAHTDHGPISKAFKPWQQGEAH